MARQRTTPFIYLLLGLACIFIIAWGIQTSAFVLNPILLAAVITVVVLPVPQKLTKRGLPGWLSFVLTLLAVVGVLALVIVLVFVSIGQISSDLASQASVLGETPDAEGGGGSLVSGLLSPAQMNQLWSLIVRLGGQAVFLAFIVLIIFIFMLSAAITIPAI